MNKEYDPSPSERIEQIEKHGGSNWEREYWEDEEARQMSAPSRV